MSLLVALFLLLCALGFVAQMIRMLEFVTGCAVSLCVFVLGGGIILSLMMGGGVSGGDSSSRTRSQPASTYSTPSRSRCPSKSVVNRKCAHLVAEQVHGGHVSMPDMCSCLWSGKSYYEVR